MLEKAGFLVLTTVVFSFANIAQGDGFQQNFYGNTNSCSTSKAYGCTGAFQSITRNEYIQNFRGQTTVCNTTSDSGCVYQGNSYPAQVGCWRGSDNTLYCY